MGLDAQSMTKLFDAFYTTKSRRHGDRALGEPLHHRETSRTPVGRAERRPRRNVLVFHSLSGGPCGRATSASVLIRGAHRSWNHRYQSLMDVPTLLADSVASCRLSRVSLRARRSGNHEDIVMVTRSLVSIVDDDESVRESLPDMVRQFGFAAQAFSSAEAFLASDVVDQTKCLILDVAMPGMSGPDLQRELATRRQGIPIVFITASGDDTIRSRAACEWGRRVPLQAVQRHSPPRCTQCGTSDEVGMTRTRTPTTTRAPYTGNSAIGSHSIVAVTMPDLTSTVFVVDDDISVRESLELLIKSAGWRAETFPSGQDFLSRPRVRIPCCLLLDVTLPGSTASSCSSGSRERTDMPIIFITGHGDIPMTVQAMKAGAVEFLTKPLQARCARERDSRCPRAQSGPRCVSTRRCAPSGTAMSH